MTLLQEYSRIFDQVVSSGEQLYLNQQIADLRSRLLPTVIRENADMLVSVRTGQLIDIQCSPGWFMIIGDALDDIKNMMKPNHLAHFSCIKEKFGGLRMYYGITHKNFVGETDEHSPDLPDGLCSIVYERIKLAEKFARQTCEICGSPGELHGNTSVQTLCDHHAQVLKRPRPDPGIAAWLDPDGETLGSILSRRL